MIWSLASTLNKSTAVTSVQWRQLLFAAVFIGSHEAEAHAAGSAFQHCCRLPPSQHSRLYP